MRFILRFIVGVIVSAALIVAMMSLALLAYVPIAAMGSEYGLFGALATLTCIIALLIGAAHAFFGQ